MFAPVAEGLVLDMFGQHFGVGLQVGDRRGRSRLPVARPEWPPQSRFSWHGYFECSLFQAPMDLLRLLREA